MGPLLPLLFSAWWSDLDRPHRLLDQNFGVGLYPEQLSSRLLDKYQSLADRAAMDLYYRPWADLLNLAERGVSTIATDKDNFKVILDVQQFKPEEINVKVVDRYVVVEAKHEEKKDEHGFISRQFVRRYLLPEEADIEQVSSSISSDGILMITAPLKPSLKKENERTIKIEYTGKPALRADTAATGREGEKKEGEGQNREETTTTTTTSATDESTTPQK